MTFVENDGKTTLTITDRFESIEDCNAALRSGMEAGVAEMYDRLAEHVATMA